MFRTTQFLVPCVLMSLLGCQPRDREAGVIRYPDIETRDHWRDIRDGVAPPELPRRVADQKRFPRATFGFVLEAGYGERIDTFNGVVTKDLVDDPDTTVELKLSDAELDTLYERALAIRLFDYPEPHPLIESMSGMQPHGTMRLQVRAGTRDITLEWDTGRVPGGKTVDEWKRLYEWIRLARKIVANRPEYRSLPGARGGYL